MSGIPTIEKTVNRPTGLNPVVGELKAALDDHDRLTQPPCFDDPRWQETDIRNGMPEESPEEGE